MLCAGPDARVSCNERGGISQAHRSRRVPRRRKVRALHCQRRNLQSAAFGLNHSVARVVKLECKIPIQFEYELGILNPSLDFQVFPLKGKLRTRLRHVLTQCLRSAGIIPPNGSTEITIAYCPKRNVTSELKLRVNISQFGFEPFICHVYGSSVPTTDPVKCAHCAERACFVNWSCVFFAAARVRWCRM